MQIESPTLKTIREKQKEYFKTKPDATEREKMDWLILHLSLKVVKLETKIQRDAKKQ